MTTSTSIRKAKPKRGDGRRLEDRNDPAVVDALTRECPRCEAPAGRYCKALRRRLVHFARCKFREDLPTGETWP